MRSFVEAPTTARRATFRPSMAARRMSPRKLATREPSFVWQMLVPISSSTVGTRRTRARASLPTTIKPLGDNPAAGTLSYSASGLPDGLDIDPVTGRITGTLMTGQQIILCSDGLSDGVSTVKMSGIMKHQHTNQAQVDALQAAALGAGGHDNITIVVVGAPAETVMEEAGDDRPDLQTTQELPSIAAAASPVGHNGKIILLTGVMMALAIWWLL